MAPPAWFNTALMEEAHRLCNLSYEDRAQQLAALQPDYEVVHTMNDKIFVAMSSRLRWLVFRGTADLGDIIADVRVSPMEVSPLCQGAAHSGFLQRAQLAPEVVTDNPADEQRKLYYSLEDGDVTVETAVATTNDADIPQAPHAVRLQIRNNLSSAISCMIPAGTVFEQPSWNKIQNVATQHAEVLHIPARSTASAIIPALCMNEQYDCPKHDNVNLTPFAVRESGAVRDQVALWEHAAAVLGCRREQLILQC
ncbi:unnamed protein product [Symbiodinium natans]|uniref:Uncharacterized protein n=1 Tax=Symbiodinium natans TaxID=878477 RepID=A0A812NRW5_9DINO|nr:unnamed protein product [Symbiodinium natans]